MQLQKKNRECIILIQVCTSFYNPAIESNSYFKISFLKAKQEKIDTICIEFK